MDGLLFKSLSEAGHYKFLTSLPDCVVQYERMSFCVRDMWNNLVNYTPDFVVLNAKFNGPIVIESKSDFDGVTHDAVMKLLESASLVWGIPVFVVGAKNEMFVVDEKGTFQQIENLSALK